MVTKRLIELTLFGGYSIGVTPVPISNTEVKPYCADDTAWETMWESRSPPKLFVKGPTTVGPFLFAEIVRNGTSKRSK